MLGTQAGQLVQALNTQTLNTQGLSAATQSVPGRSADTQSGQESLMLNTGVFYSFQNLFATWSLL